MTTTQFIDLLTQEVESFKEMMETSDNEWIVKGLIDVNKNIYSLTNDTKIVSKIIEILLVPKLDNFAKKHNLLLELASKQNYYPDISFKDLKGNLFAVDLKSSYYDGNEIHGLTLGSYWGYFRERDITKSTNYPYNSYQAHIVIGILYKKVNINIDKQKMYEINQLSEIQSVIKDFKFFVQPKWKIASDKVGSGNTRNIGSITNIQQLQKGEGPFSELGEDVFDDYWIGYFNKADARTAGIGNPKYYNLKTYQMYLKTQAKNLAKFQNKKTCR